MIIKEIELNNFRIYKGCNKIDLSVNDNENIVIVSGKNGYGKTTFLMSLVWCLYGKNMEKVDDIYKTEIKNYYGYNRYIDSCLNRQAREEGATSFSVSITFINVHISELGVVEQLKITREYNTKNGNETLEVLIDGKEDELINEMGKDMFVNDVIMPNEIAKFFFFDAEKIVSLAEIHTPEQRKGLSDAYIAVLGIKKYQDLISDLNAYKNKIKKESMTVEELNELANITTLIENNERENKDCDKKIEEINRELDDKNQQIDKLQEKLIRNGDYITVEQLENLKEEAKHKENLCNELQSELKSHFEMIPFAISGELLKEVFERIVLERNFIDGDFNNNKLKDISKKILDAFVNLPKPEGVWVSIEIDEYYRGSLKKLLKEYLLEDKEPGEEKINIIHNYSEGQKNDIEQFINDLKNTFVSKFERISRDYTDAKNRRDAINRKIKEAEINGDNPLIAEDRKRKTELENERDNKLQEIGKLNQQKEDRTEQIKQYKKKKEKMLEDKISSAKYEKVAEKVQNTIDILNQFISEFKKKRVESLSVKIKEGLNQLLHKKNFIKEVDVQTDSNYIEIKLLGSKNKEIKIDSLSKGEQQLYATALLKGLVDESGISFPVFIDSPMQKFDIDHSHSIVKYFYPNVSEQVIIFPLLKKEMSKEEFDLLLPKISKTYLINNINDSYSKFEIVKNKEELFEIFEKDYQNAI